ncbi:MAG TPA: hypothetical protein VML55_11640 [Planctomycetaceae bacterium]|nr:hypothetical protein [Planctomycetaceae bacterium]
MSRRGRANAAFSLFAFQDIITSVTGIMLLVTMLLALELLQRQESSPPAATAQISRDLEQVVAEQRAEIKEIEAQLSQEQAELAELAAYDLARAERQSAELAGMNRRLEQELAELRRNESESERRAREARAREQQQATDARTVEQLQDEARRKQAQLARLKAAGRVVFNPTAGDAKTPWLVEVAAAGLSVAETGRAAPPQTFADAGSFLAWARRQNPAAVYFVLLIKPDGIETYRTLFAELRRLNFDLGFDLLTSSQTALDPQTGAALE